MVLFENDSISDGVNNVVRDKHTLELKCEIRKNDKDTTSVNTFFRDVKALNNWIEKINDKYDETLNNTFTGVLIRYTKIFTKIKRSNHGGGCHRFEKIVEYRGNLCYIPEENKCFRKCLDFQYKKDFSQQYRDFIKKS